jgi:uncharacterized protein (DUF4415 family)
MKKHKPDCIAQEDWDAVDSPALLDSFLTTMQPVHKNHPDIPLRVRGPQKALHKVPVALRLDPSVVNAFRATGRGWQSRVNAILRDSLKEHNPV